MHRWLALLLCFSVLTNCGTSQKDREEGALRMRIGTSFLQQRNYAAAIRELELAEKKDPRSPQIQNNLGLAYFMKDRFDLAELHLRQALSLKPDYTEARNNLARVLIEEAKYNEAIVALKQVTSDLTYEDVEKGWNNLGLAYFRKGDYRAAKTALANSIKINRDDCYAQSMFGRAQLEQADFQQAAESLDRAVTICQKQQFDEPHYYSGLAYLKLGDTGKAVARMEEVMKLYPNGDYAKKAKSILQMINR